MYYSYRRTNPCDVIFTVTSNVTSNCHKCHIHYGEWKCDIFLSSSYWSQVNVICRLHKEFAMIVSLWNLLPRDNITMESSFNFLRLLSDRLLEHWIVHKSLNNVTKWIPGDWYFKTTVKAMTADVTWWLNFSVT